MDLANLQYHILGEIITCILSAVLCVNILSTFTPSERRQRIFLYASIATFFSTLVNIFSVICISYFQYIPLSLCYTCTTIYFLLIVSVPLIMADYAVEIAFSYKGNKTVINGINLIVYAVYAAIIILNLRTGWVFSYDSQIGYVRGRLKMITYILMFFYTFVSVFIICINKKSLAKRVFIVFLAYPFVAASFMIIQFLLPNVILTGASCFSSILMAYLTIQSDMIEFDSVTGLLGEHKLRTHLEAKKSPGFLYVMEISNCNFIQNNMPSSNFNQMLLDIGKLFSKSFERRAYHSSTSRFEGICTTKDELMQYSEQIRNFIETINENLSYNLPVQLETYNAAIEFFGDGTPINVTNVSEIINNLLEKARNNLTTEVCLCDDSVLADMERKRIIYNILKRELNLESTQYQVWYQPIYSIKEKKFTYMEALSRLRGTEIGDISPQEFVAVAERRGLIEKLGFVAFEKVCKFIADNKDYVNAVSINFSVPQMTNPSIVNTVLNTIKRFNLDPANIIMEITESSFIDDFDLVRKNMVALADAGVQFYLDDFGTGYSNLSNVVQLPFKTIKMDRSLVLMMESNPKNAILFSNLVSTFKGADLKILVEGVETELQNHLVQNAEVDNIQGFLYSRPLPEDKCLELLKKQK